ncbi:MAG TPA: transcription antitermination factor NusB [Gammaproteobacteria bacterium]|nr:transcription antitermination factor NusB [Gammaproteobacteria bacterium]
MPNDPKNPLDHENKTIDFSARHHARRYAVQAMYQWQIAATPLNELENEFLRYQINKKFDLAYFKEMIHGIPQYQQEIDQEMQPYLERNLKEIDPVELAVLRLAIYELLHRLDIPYRVIINEALQLTKKFGSIEGYKFVNSILDRIAKKRRSDEILPPPFVKGETE